jgi:hypothetical protein
MKKPLYRWVCTMCGISDEAENSEMARINIDLHVRVAHPSARKAVKVQPDSARDLVVLGDEHDDDAGGAADGKDGRVRS